MTADRFSRFPLTFNQAVETRYRRVAAVVALVFPLVPVTFLILGFARNGFEGLSTHPLLVTSLPAGLTAILFWVKRYSRAAVTALRSRGRPISVRGNSVEFFGQTFPMSAASSLAVEGKKVLLLDGDRVLASEPTYFAKGGTWL
jgi:hypothetical protein